MRAGPQDRLCRRRAGGEPWRAVLVAVRCVVLGLLAAATGCSIIRGDPATESPASPGVRGAAVGLEVRVWVVPDDPRVFAAALEPLAARPPPGAADARDVWSANGLRLILAREEELASLAAGLGAMGPGATQWIGERGDWTDIVRGPWLSSGVTLALDSGVLDLDEGRLRLLCRCWMEPVAAARTPGVAPGPALRVELVPQHEDRSRPRQEPARSVEPRPASRIEDLGQVFTRLLADLDGRPGDAVLIVPEAPDADWSALAKPAEPPQHDEAPFVGPLPPAAPSLGEAMLVTGTGRGRVRAIVVMIPRLPDRVRLSAR